MGFLRHPMAAEPWMEVHMVGAASDIHMMSRLAVLDGLWKQRRIAQNALHTF